jgi:hypothetical protein
LWKLQLKIGYIYRLGVNLMVFNDTFNNISAISWRSVLLVDETGVPGETITCRKSLTNFITECCIECTSPWTRFELKTLVMIGTDCTGSNESNYHTISTMTAPIYLQIKFLLMSYYNIAVLTIWWNILVTAAILDGVYSYLSNMIFKEEHPMAISSFLL